ncbi:MAG: hypothetical protein LBH43_03780 [Treponema sp.]|nr:hypothetical protein [Treponema sp.]
MNEFQKLQKIPSAAFRTIRRRRSVLFLILAFFAGCLLSGFYFNRHRFAGIGELNQRYYSQYGKAAETVGRLEEELGRERELNRLLREHNNRARELTGELTGTTERNVRNLQDAVAIIGEIRAKLKVLAEFYADSNTGNSGN